MRTLKKFLTESSLQTNKAFVQKIYSKGHPSFGPGVLFCFRRDGDKDSDDPICVKVVLEAYDEYVYFKELSVLGEGEDFGKGIGTHMMKLITKEADSMGIYMELTAEPLLIPQTRGKAMSQSKLIAWYKKFGFVSHKGSPRDMFRKPK